MFDLIPFKFNNLERGFLTDFFNDDFFSGRLGSFKTDISENEKEYLIEAELPGFSKEDINIEITDGRLTISAKRNNETEEKQDNYLRKERFMGQVTRSFIVDNINEDEIKANFKDGVLKLSLPKREEAANKVRRIELN